MGTRISQSYLDELRRRERRPPETEIFLSPAATGYVYLINISHPRVAPYYDLYKLFTRNRIYPLSDHERKLFEADMICCLFKEECKKRHNESVVNFYAGYLIRYRDEAERWRRYRELHAPAAHL